MMENTMMDKIESMSVDFLKTSTESYIKEKITTINSKEQLTLEFKYIMVAMSPNGGLIAMCKTKDYFDAKKTRINDYVIIMHQDGSKKYHIKIDWNYKERYIVSLEFSENGRLYGFCNDGTIYKFDILTEKALEKTSSYKLKSEKIVKAKLFDKGFIVLTGEGNIYVVKDIKDPIPLFIVSVYKQLGFSKEIEFLGIPPTKSMSGKFELLITNEKGNGVLHIEQQGDGNIKSKEDQKAFKGAVKLTKDVNTSIEVSILTGNKLEKYSSGSGYYQSQGEYENVDFDDLQGKKMGKITAMAISPSKEKIALYCAEKKIVYIIGSRIGKINNIKEELTFQIDNECGEIGEQKAILSFHEKYQFLFCGEDCLAIAGQRFIIIINQKNETIACQIIEGRQMEAMNGKCFCQCITEIDGIRYFTEDGIYLISPVCKDLYELCDPFSEIGTRKLINAYSYNLKKSPECNVIIKEIKQDLPSIIFSLLRVAANLYWTERDSTTKDKKEIQNYLIKAAQFGKSFVEMEDFNFSKFNDLCKAIRIVTNMRNCDQPTFITYQEHLTLDPDNPNNNIDLVKKLIRDLNFDLAFNISEYLGYDIENVYQSYAIARIKQLPYGADKDTQNALFDKLDLKLKDIPNISYIAIAKKCIKYGKYDLAEAFLKNEKSILVKIPQYLQLKKWDDALILCLQSCDWSVIQVVLDKIWRVEEPENFIEIVKKYPDAHTAVLDFFKRQNKEKELIDYLNSKKNEGEEELLFMTLEKFFSSQDIEKREKYIKECKTHLKNAKNIDKDFYEKYLDDLKNSIEFKKNCIEKNIITSTDISVFDNSIYDCFNKGVENEYSWIDSQNRKFFKISNKKVSFLAVKALAEKRDEAGIAALVKNYGFKKLELSPLKAGKILYDNKIYTLATEYIKQETDPEKFDEKIELLDKMQKYLEMVEVAMIDKRNDRLNNIVNDVLSKRKELKDQINELSKKYKVNLSFGK